MYNLRQLADGAGVTPRTIRYYIAQGLLPSAVGQGRGAHYTEGHMTRLTEIGYFQGLGHTLDEIKRRFEGPLAPTPSDVSPGSTWSRFDVTDDVTVLVRQGRSAALGGSRAGERAQIVRALQTLVDTMDEA